MTIFCPEESMDPSLTQLQAFAWSVLCHYSSRLQSSPADTRSHLVSITRVLRPPARSLQFTSFVFDSLNDRLWKRNRIILQSGGELNVSGRFHESLFLYYTQRSIHTCLYIIINPNCSHSFCSCCSHPILPDMFSVYCTLGLVSVGASAHSVFASLLFAKYCFSPDWVLWNFQLFIKTKSLYWILVVIVGPLPRSALLLHQVGCGRTELWQSERKVEIFQIFIKLFIALWTPNIPIKYFKSS